MLKISNLHAKVDGKAVLKGVNLEVKAGEVHAIMGPNGAGKSTLSKVLAGHPSYQVTQGEAWFDVNFKPTNLLEMEADVRAKEGLFLGLQYPVEIPGVSNLKFLQTAFNSIMKHQGAEPLEDLEFKAFLKKKLQIISMSENFLERGVNQGFSGGEKKKNEILQMAVLSPKLALLDETDSGLDVDALRVVSEGVNKLKSQDNAIVLITHYQRLLDYIRPDHVHIFMDGKIVQSGDFSLATKVEKQGYDWLVH